MNSRHGLASSVLQHVAKVLERHVEVERAILFGSRAKAMHRPGSDIDIALTGSLLDWRIVGIIYDELDDLLLPYRFSLIILDNNTDPEVAAHIARVGIPVFVRHIPSTELLRI